MNTSKSVIIGLGLLASTSILRAQLQTDITQSAQPDSIVQITAEAEGLTRVDPATLTPFASCWWTVFPNSGPVPMPCPPQDLSVPIYEMANGIYLVDETGGSISVSVPQRTTSKQATLQSATVAAVDRQGNAIANLIEQVQATQTVQPMARAMSLSANSLTPGDGGSSSNAYTANDASYVQPDYGTNLWLAQTYVAGGYMGGIGTNTMSDVQYEIQSRTNLVQADWQSEGFIYGSELTNWTPLSVAQNGRINLFIRLKSWASSDRSGLPDWWELEYFGTNGVDPNANPMGDGWSNIQKFQNGMNPNVFYTPPAPQGVAVSYNGGNNSATVSWLSSPGPVTGYTVTSTYYPPYGTGGTTQTKNFTVAANTTAITDNALLGAPNPWEQANYPTTYKVQASYAGGNSSWSREVPLETSTFSGAIVAGPQGNPVLLVSGVPADTAAIRLTELSVDALNWWNTNFYVTNIDIAISSFSNGSCVLPNWSQTNNIDGYYWIGRTIGTNGAFSAGAYLSYNQFTTPKDNYKTSWMVPPFYDGRVQLKQNLIFQLRAAAMDAPFHFFIPATNVYDGGTFGGYVGHYTYPTNYAYAGLYSFSNPSQYSYYDFTAEIDPFWPFEENCLFRNFVFTPADVDGGGALTTGVTTDTYNGYQLFYRPLAYQCQTNWTSFPALLATNSTRWLFYNQSDDYDTAYGLGLLNLQYNDNDVTFYMTNGYRNWFGLKYTSANVAYDGLDNNFNDLGLTTNVVSAGNSLTSWVFFYSQPNAYLETEQPKFKTVQYDFWQPEIWSAQSQTWAYPLPGDPDFSPNNTSPVIFAAVGSKLTLAGYAKLEVTNSLYTGVYAYLGQYFDTAYTMTNGAATGTNTGVLSPYGSFFPTKPGPTALVTMPDVDTGARGTCAVYTVSIVVDRNQGNNMDVTFNGPNATSLANPAQVWANNNYDRWHTVDGNDSEQDDLGQVDIAKLPAEQVWPDCQYTISGFPAIPSTRDLEDYFRLWLPGVAAAMKVMPADYSVRLALTGDGQIRLFHAIEADGGTNYLFDEVTASNQVNNSISLYVGLLTSNSPVYLTIQTNFNEHFIFCGAHTGSAQVDLQILDGNGNTVADSTTYLQINDIKLMYERWTVGDTPSRVPLTNALAATEDLPAYTPAFQYTAPTDTNTPYILFIHGWNMERWEKDRFAETAFKRLYWQGYQGRFGSFRWPTHYNFGSWTSIAFDSQNFDNSESNAWASATGLLNKLTNLNGQYPGHVYLMAHSMGNVVAGEALRKASSQPVNTYVAMQGAIASHAYDATTPTRSLGIQDSSTPDCYAHYWTNNAPCYFASSAGAGTYVNFFNTNDWALNSSHWQMDQNLKPDDGFAPYYPNYYFSRADDTRLNFPTNTYEIFAYCDEARCFALGAQADVGGVFGGNQRNLSTVWPYDAGNYSTHRWHSAEFRSDNMQRALFWNQTLINMKLK
jgi:pimeloyl-ACP methyl ester carboxylesterase